MTAESHAAQEPGRINGLAVASLLCGIATFGIGSVLAVILGRRARKQIRDSDGAERGNGLAVAGLILGWLGIAAAIVVLVVVVTSHERRVTRQGHDRADCSTVQGQVSYAIWQYQHKPAGPGGNPPSLAALYASRAGKDISGSAKRVVQEYGGNFAYDPATGEFALNCPSP